MLHSLTVSNYALIDHIEIEFDKGLNIITGETGSGKSIVMGALGLLMGERAETRMIRDNSKKTVIEAQFIVKGDDAVADYLLSSDLDNDGDTCILRRELTARGTSRAFINDTPVNLTQMKEVAERLVDIHTQNDNALLRDPAFQLRILDSLGKTEGLLQEYKLRFSEYKKALKEYTRFRDEFNRSKSEKEYNQYLLGQLVELDVKEGEQERLEKERDIAQNSAEIRNALSQILDNLIRSENSVVDRIIGSENALSKLGGLVKEINGFAERLESARIEIDDIAQTLQEYESAMTVSGLEPEEIEQRLSDIYNLESRHRVSTDKELIEIRRQLEKSLSVIENGEDELERLESEAKAAKRRLVLAARQLSEARQNVIPDFEKALMERAMPLGMANLRCQIRLTQVKPHESGIDNVEFLFAFNKSQPLMPIGKTASGGEIARVILAIKSLLVENISLPTIIFDEIDTGVSGDMANRIARLMLDISRKTQVITITHIAAVAAHGKHHFKVYKEDIDNATNTRIKLLDDKERVSELAAMISGDSESKSARDAALSLLENQ